MLAGMNTIRFKLKCSVPGCPNERTQGTFIGNTCMPCLMFLRGLTDQPFSQAARNAERRRKARELTMRAHELNRQLGDEPS